jgi:hypothetical protein
MSVVNGPLCMLGLVVLAVSGSAAAAQPDSPPAQAAGLSAAAKQWWTDISVLADDKMEGRQTGSAGYLRAADYVVSRFKSEGLKPAGTTGFLQPVTFEQQVVDQRSSTLDLVGADNAVTPLLVGQYSRISPGGAPIADTVDAPLVFLGYGLHLPQQGADDFAGMDVKGKIVVVLSGGPSDISGPVKSNARFARSELLGKLGAVGLISLTTPKQVEIPWARQLLLAGQPGMYLADRSLRETPDGFVSIAIDPDKSESLFTGSGHTFAELCALADASKSVPRFELPFRLKGRIAVSRSSLTSPNIVAKLPGRDPALAAQYVVISAHLDHLGIGAAINGDSLYNGAMDDASGVAAVLDIAHRVTRGVKPRRSMLFLIVTAEEKGLLGSHYFARHPTVPQGSIVADLNFDMPLPLWTLKSVFAPGEGESSLGADARAVAEEQGLTMAPDALPDRNVFIRTDQFSFVREGIPSLAFKFGFAKDTPEFKLEHEWRATRYHAPSDDVEQPGVMKEEAVRLDGYVAALALRIGNADSRPQWLPTSVFKPDGYTALTTLFREWRAFERPVMRGDDADYSDRAMKAKADALPNWRQRLDGIGTEGWSVEQSTDYKLVKAEMNGLDFDLRVLRPWARDPAFYVSVRPNRTDVPSREGPVVYPQIEMYAYQFPLSLGAQRELTRRLGAIPALLDQARVNLRDSNARDLWVFGEQELRNQARALASLQAGTLTVSTLEGSQRAVTTGFSRELRHAVDAARRSTDTFVAWLEHEAPGKTGPSGVGKDNYTWYQQQVHFVPFDWDEQVVLLRRELERAQASLRLEEQNNRRLPPLEPVADAAAFDRLAHARLDTFVGFLVRQEIIPDKPYLKAALEPQLGHFVPEDDRVFFTRITHREPMLLLSHDYHWFDLARMRDEPNPSPIRRLASLSNIWDTRAEGFATAFEELLMHAGLYDDNPRAKELVWIMLANRAARGLASLYVQANQMTLEQAGKFHAEWTPRGWANARDQLTAFEQLLYLRQPGYGTSYVIGKILLDRLMADYGHQQDVAGRPFVLREFLDRFNREGMIPLPLMETEMISRAVTPELPP